MFCFVILHYQSIDDTRKCIESIKKLNTECKIVVVDNCSPNKSGDVLLAELDGKDNISVIKTEKNLGFAKGNNAGFRYAKEKFDPSFIACINSDVIINDADFIGKVREAYESTGFDVMGPDVYNPETEHHQSPVRLRLLTQEDIAAIAKQNRKQLMIAYVKYAMQLVGVKKKGRSIEKRADNGFWKNEHRNCVLHGAFVIYSKKYIENEDEAFVPDTFLYYEEDLLALKCGGKGYEIYYTPRLQIYHMEGKSTSADHPQQLKKDFFVIKEGWRSIKIMKDYYGKKS